MYRHLFAHQRAPLHISLPLRSRNVLPFSQLSFRGIAALVLLSLLTASAANSLLSLKAQAYSETLTSSGSWVAPAGVTSVTVEVWGGGGAGGGATGNPATGGGGAGGAYARSTLAVTPGTSYTYTVGAVKTATTTSTQATNTGNPSWFDSTSTVYAPGGQGGGPTATNSSNGAAGTGSSTGAIGDVVYAGGNGSTGDFTSTTGYSGAGGGGAGSTGAGGNASAGTGGTGTSENGGNGANGVGNSVVGADGSTYGGGGSGGKANSTTDRAGGDGAAGLIRLTYNGAPSFTVTPTDSPDPVDEGNSVTFSATATDPESDDWKLVVCKTNVVTGGVNPTCASSQTLCVSSSAVASGAQNTCSWTSTGDMPQDWYAFACDDASTDPRCSSADTTNSPVIVNGPVLNQEGFRFRNDDGDEDAATWIAAQDSSITKPQNQNIRLRTLLDSSEDPYTQDLQLEYKKTIDSTYSPVSVQNDPGITPVIESVATGATSAVDTTTHAITMPSGINAGDLLLLVFSNDGSPGTNAFQGNLDISTGWVRLGPERNGSIVSGSIFYKFADGNDSATITTTSAEQSSHVVYRISGADIPMALGANGSSTNSDAPDLDTGVSRNYLWIATRHGDAQVVATAAPTGYTDLQTVTAADANGASTNTAVKSSTSSSENPGTFTSASEQWAAWTIAIPSANNGVKAMSVGALGTTSVAVEYPTGIEEGDLLVMSIVNKEGGTAAPTTPSGWDTISNYQATAGAGAAGLDVGTVTTTVYTKVATGTETGTESVTVTSGNVTVGRMVVVKKSPNTNWDIAAVNGSDTTINSTWQVTGGSDPGIESGDIVLVTSGINTDAYGYNSHGMTATGVTFGWNHELFEYGTTTGNDIEMVMTMHQALSGTSSSAPTLTMTANTTSTNNPAGAAVMLRIRQTDPPIYITDSTNIGSSGETTTAQLTPPSGKTTSDFTAGRIQDDENPADAINIGSNDYTEVEWNMTATDVAQDGDIYQFRVTKNGHPLDSYIVTPQWTIGTSSNNSPTLTIAEPDGTGDTVAYDSSYTITYTLDDPEETVTAAFYYDTNNSGTDGVALTGACATAAEGTGATCLWDFSGIAAGSYYIYGVVDDGVNSPVTTYSSGQLTISAEVSSLEQEGFRFRDDDGDEDAATWLAGQDTNITRTTNLATRLRLLLNATNSVGGQEYQLEYKKSTDSEYTAVGPVGGPVAPAPVVESVATGDSGTTDATSHTITMPTGITAGDLLVLVFSSDGAPGNNDLTGEARMDAGNWIRLDFANSSNIVTGAVFYKFAEGGDTGTVITTSAEQSSHVVYRISGAGVPRSTSSEGSGTDTDPPELETVLSHNNVWIATRSGDDTVVATAAPSGYSSLQTQAAAGSGGASTNTAVKTSQGSTENPGAFTSASEHWVSFTIAVPSSSMGLDGMSIPANSGSTSFSVNYPLDVSAGDLLVLTLSNKYPPNDPSTPTGWTLLSGAKNTGGSGATATDDSGDVYATIFVKEADGTETGSLSVSIPSNNSVAGRMMSVRKEDGATWDLAATGGADNTPGTSWSVTGSGDPDIEAGDLIIVATAINTNANDYTSPMLAVPGVTVGWNHLLLQQQTGNGNDISLTVSQHGAIDGASSGVPVFTMDSSATSGDEPAGASTMVRIRQVGGGTSDAPIVLSESTNITASGENTTAQLTAPSGKSTSDFTAGRIQDDENPADTVTIADDDYTELEWSIMATDNAVADEVYQFRVTLNGTPLDTYTVTPQWTIGTGGTPTFTLSAYRWYEDNNSENVTEPWGNPDLAANTQIGVIPATLNAPPITSTELRLRVGITVNTNALNASAQQFKLQYKAGTDASCTTGSWTDIAAGGGGGIWRFATSGVTDGTTLTNIRLTSTTDVLQVYAKANPTATNPNSATAGQDVEYDFHIQHNGAGDATTYSFRVVESDDTVFDAYTVCPTLMTAPGTAQLLRHGEVFAEESKRGKLWAN